MEAINRSSLRATTHTCAPFSKSSSTTARPMPALPPVTIATRSLIPRFIVCHPFYISLLLHLLKLFRSRSSYWPDLTADPPALRLLLSVYPGVSACARCRWGVQDRRDGNE